MAKGTGAIERQAQQTAEARARNAQSFKPQLKVGERTPGPFIIRFLEQGEDVNNFPVHSYRVPPNGNDRGFRSATCLSEVGLECPMCQAGMKLGVRGVYNVIQRQRPQLRKDKDGKAIKDPMGQYIIDGTKDEIVIANVGGPTAEMLRKVDASYRGMASRDFQVSFSGDTFQSWTLAPVLDGAGSSNPTPLTESDMALLAAGKHDLDEFMKPVSHAEAVQIVQRYGGGGGGGGAQSSGGSTSPQGNAAQAGTASGFTAGAQVPQGVPVSGGAFAGAQTPAAAPVPQVAPAPVPVPQSTDQPTVPVIQNPPPQQ